MKKEKSVRETPAGTTRRSPNERPMLTRRESDMSGAVRFVSDANPFETRGPSV